MFDRLHTHLKATPGWALTAAGVGGDVLQHHTLTVLSGLAILSGIAYHVTLIVCAVVKTRHEIQDLERKRFSAWERYLTYDQFEGRN